MSTILRRRGLIYGVDYYKVPVEVVANSEREFPESWIFDSRNDVADEFVRYARPLIGENWVSVPMVGGLQPFARQAPIYAEEKLEQYIPQEHRKERP